MANIKLTAINSSAKLLQALAKKTDFDGDGTLTARDVEKAATGGIGSGGKRRLGDPAPPAGAPTLDGPTWKALTAAINRAKGKSQFEVKDVQAGIEDVRKKLVALDTDGNGQVTEAELKKLKPDGKALAMALLAFADAHAGDKLADFKVASQASAGVWTPSTPFHAPANASPVKWLEAAVKHFDAFSNDNRWPGGQTTRLVLGNDEAKGLVAEVAKLPAATAKAVLKELSKQIKSSDVPRPYLLPSAVKYVDALAHQLGLNASFTGVATAPKFPGY